MYTLIVIRHGQSQWNRENRFTGWTDVPLSEQGKEEAEEAGKLLKKAGFTFDLAYTSFLLRAIDTLRILLQEMGLTGLSVVKTWRLNERHYGALQGLNKAEIAEKYGAEQVQIWRRSFDIAPPALAKDDPRSPAHDPLYADLAPTDLPLTESLKDTIARMLPFIEETLFLEIKAGKKVLISAHGNSLRALMKHLENISDANIPLVEIPTGIPLVYKLDADLKVVEKYYLK